MSDPYDPRSISAPFAPTATREQFSEESVVQEQIDLIVDQMRAQEGNSGFEWNLAQLDDFTAVTAGLLTMVQFLLKIIQATAMDLHQFLLKVIQATFMGAHHHGFLLKAIQATSTVLHRHLFRTKTGSTATKHDQ
ncbi:hypothetical protein M7I_3998 [Glarea lozoyensis 74030]|uniref:Uncharacterized protein n=1 Tax=Glarea lozoyensis (strain ATCC 74030 / MF5533) TaxID=1104152 RepID=H0EMZ9_GLAL7|nr:hypothetical protein M7I_3998 [Glarea lozoyensis 74030]